MLMTVRQIRDVNEYKIENEDVDEDGDEDKNEDKESTYNPEEHNNNV